MKPAMTVSDSTATRHPIRLALRKNPFAAIPAAMPPTLVRPARPHATSTPMAFPAGLIIRQSTGIDWVHIPYKGGAPTQQALIAGEVPVAIFSNTRSTAGRQAGKNRALAVLDRQRL